MSEIFDDRCSQSTRYIKRRISDSPGVIEINDDDSEKKIVLKPAFWNSLVAGGLAGIVVDFTLYPLDTIKTRLQSHHGFRDSGGFSKLYKGIAPVLVCSAPVSALFFCVYNSTINVMRTEKTQWDPIVYIIAASAAEALCSTVRVPLEIVKQRKQTSNGHSYVILKKAVEKEGIMGLYRGFSSTIAREVPFACIQFPLWEYMIEELIIYQNGEPLTALQTAYCGAVAGGIAGALTTPVDVMKTRIMLAEKEKIQLYKPKVYQNFAKEIYFERGITGFFSGLIPRTAWIMLGGFIYFGTYEEVKLICEEKWCFIKRKIKAFQKWLPWNIESEMEKFWEHCSEYNEVTETSKGKAEKRSSERPANDTSLYQDSEENSVRQPNDTQLFQDPNNYSLSPVEKSTKYPHTSGKISGVAVKQNSSKGATPNQNPKSTIPQKSENDFSPDE